MRKSSPNSLDIAPCAGGTAIRIECVRASLDSTRKLVVSDASSSCWLVGEYTVRIVVEEGLGFLRIYSSSCASRRVVAGLQSAASLYISVYSSVRTCSTYCCVWGALRQIDMQHRVEE